MTQNQDKTILMRLAAIAEELEAVADVAPPDSLRRDQSLIAQLKRIEDAVGDAFTATVVGATNARTISFALQDPENFRTHIARGTQSFCIWLNDSANDFLITRLVAISDTDDYTFSLFTSASETDIGTGTDSLLVSVVCGTDGVAMFYYDSDDELVVPSGCWLIWEHGSGTADVLTVVIEGQFE